MSGNRTVWPRPAAKEARSQAEIDVRTRSPLRDGARSKGPQQWQIPHQIGAAESGASAFAAAAPGLAAPVEDREQMSLDNRCTTPASPRGRRRCTVLPVAYSTGCPASIRQWY